MEQKISGEYPNGFDFQTMKEKHDRYLSRRELALIDNEHDLEIALFLLDIGQDATECVNEYALLRNAERDTELGRSSSITSASELVSSREPTTSDENEFAFRNFTNNKENIYKLIAEEIGMKYRTLGRELGLREGALDQIDLEQRRIEDRVYKILGQFEEIEERSNIPNQLCEALECCRRADLARKVRKKLL